MSDATIWDLTEGIAAVDAEAGAIDPPGMAQLLADLNLASTVEEALTMGDASVENVGVGLTDAQAATVRDTWQSMREAIRLGEIRPSDAPEAFEWIHYYLNVPVITPADLASHQLRIWLQTYAVTRGWVPPNDGTAAVQYPSGMRARPGVPTAYPAPGSYTPPADVPSPGGQSVAAGMVDIGNQQIPVPGFTARQAAAISRALAVASADWSTVTGRAIDQMLPGEAPGQVPAELRQQSAAIDRLINQVRSVWHTLGAPHVGGIEEEIRRLQVSAHRLTEAADRLEAQMRGEDRSRLLDLIRADGRRLHNQGRWLHHVVEVLPTLAPIGVVHELEAEWRHVEAQLSERSPSYLFDTIRGLETQTKAVRQQVDQLVKTSEACCEEFQQAQRDVGGRPAWKQLGGLLGSFWIVSWLIGIVTTLVAALDPQQAIMAVATDTEAMSGWVDGALGVAAADLSWADRLAGVNR